MSSPYKPLGHRKNCKCPQCKRVREWNKRKSERVILEMLQKKEAKSKENMKSRE